MHLKLMYFNVQNFSPMINITSECIKCDLLFIDKAFVYFIVCEHRLAFHPCCAMNLAMINVEYFNTSRFFTD